jgi:hypothetical protein
MQVVPKKVPTVARRGLNERACKLLKGLEARAGIEPAHKGFADLSLIVSKTSIFSDKNTNSTAFVRFLSTPRLQMALRRVLCECMPRHRQARRPGFARPPRSNAYIGLSHPAVLTGARRHQQRLFFIVQQVNIELLVPPGGGFPFNLFA